MPQLGLPRTLQASDFALHGFDGLREELDQRLQNVEIRGGTPEYAVVENAIFVPGTKVAASDRGPGRFVTQGALLANDGLPVEFAQARRRSFRWGEQVRGGVAEPVAIEPADEIDEDVVYLGWFFTHFGHFLMESLTRTWVLEDMDPSVKVVFHRKVGAAPAGITSTILSEFGIPEERMLFFDRPTRLRRVIVPEPLYELSYAAHEWMPHPFRAVAARLAAGATPLDQPVYLSRRLLPSGRRQIIGEFELEEVLRENGFRIAHPETMSFADQVRLVNQHEHILTSAGSAAYNLFFSLTNPTLHFMTAGIPREDYFLTPAVTGAAAAFCNCFGLGGRPQLNTTPLLLDLPRIIEYLDANGLLTRRLAASFATRARGLQTRFDDVWLYSMIQDTPGADTLSSELEQEALDRSPHSWPLSWALAQYFVARDPGRVEDLASQFAALIEPEQNISRLRLYHRDIDATAARVLKRCSEPTAERLAATLADRLSIAVDVEPRREGRRTDRGARRGGDADS